MNKLNLGDYLLVALFITLAVLLWCLFTTPAHPSQTGVCCAITVEQTTSHTASVHYWSSNTDESFDMYVSVEYPDEDYTTEEQLQQEIEYAISEMQDMCYHNHYEGSEESTEDRALSLDMKDCYTWQEIEFIVFGEIQE